MSLGGGSGVALGLSGAVTSALTEMSESAASLIYHYSIRSLSEGCSTVVVSGASTAQFLPCFASAITGGV